MPDLVLDPAGGQARLSGAPDADLVGALAALGSSLDECVRLVTDVTEVPATRQPLAAIKAALAAAGAPAGSGAFERIVLSAAIARSRPALATYPVASIVKQYVLEAWTRMEDPRYPQDVSRRNFPALCKIATLRRFPAGQWDWEVSGLPRSWVPRIRPLGALVRTLALVTVRMHGFGPAFFIHMGSRGNNYALLERQAERSYYRIAQSMALQPAIGALLASSWLHSPDTFAVSPHLGWLNRVFLEHGAIVATIGRADPDSGVLHRSPERRRAYDEGRFHPTEGLVIWPREEMLAWASTHQHLGDEP